MSKALIVTLGLAFAVPAAAEEAQTAMWYVAHPQQLRYDLMKCRNDPGNPWLHHRCENVTAAQGILDEAEARRHVDMTSPRNPAYWRRHPQELGPKIASCGHFEQGSAEWHTFYCDSATAAEGR